MKYVYNGNVIEEETIDDIVNILNSRNVNPLEIKDCELHFSLCFINNAEVYSNTLNAVLKKLSDYIDFDYNIDKIHPNIVEVSFKSLSFKSIYLSVTILFSTFINKNEFVLSIEDSMEYDYKLIRALMRHDSSLIFGGNHKLSLLINILMEINHNRNPGRVVEIIGNIPQHRVYPMMNTLFYKTYGMDYNDYRQCRVIESNDNYNLSISAINEETVDGIVEDYRRLILR